jgi:hypothetical protein
MTAASILLSAWLGAALLFSAVVAPAAFAVLPSRVLAGALVGRVLPVIFVAGIVAAGLALLLQRRAPPRRPRAAAIALLTVAAACAIAQFGVGPRIAGLRAEIGGAIDSLPSGDPRRVAFGRLHVFSVAWLGIAMLGAGASIAVGAIPHRRAHTAGD